MERSRPLLFLLSCLVVSILGAVPKVEVTKTAEGSCVAIRAKDGNIMTVDYEGSFENGTVFDSSFTRNETFTFALGDAGLIKGWNMGLRGTCIGDELRLEIPYALGYGDKGIPSVIPPRTNLIFRINVLAIYDHELMLIQNETLGGDLNATDSTSDHYDDDDDEDDDDYDPEGNPKPYDPSNLWYKLQFLAIPVAVILFLLVAYCIYTVEYPDRKIKFYRVSDHDNDGGLSRVI